MKLSRIHQNWTNAYWWWFLFVCVLIFTPFSNFLVLKLKLMRCD